MLTEKIIFIDIVTTGHRPTQDEIIEIGFYEWQQGKIIASWHKLIRPSTNVPETILFKTGINLELLETADDFSAIAPELFSLLKGKLLIAQNAYFKYSFLKNAFKKYNFKFTKKILCINNLINCLAEKNHQPILSELSSYLQENAFTKQSRLEKVEHILNAFLKISANYETNFLQTLSKNLVKTSALPATPLAKELIEALPETPGVYKFLGKDASILYIGKSINLRKRVISHFTAAANDNKEMQLAQQVKDVKWITTIGELGALLQEAKMVKQQMPIFNRKLRRHRALFAISTVPVPNDYTRVEITTCQQPADEASEVTYNLFRQKVKAVQMLRKIAKDYGLCLKLLGLEAGKGPCFFYHIRKCQGACINEEPIEIYNQRVRNALMGYLYKSWPFSNRIAIKETCQLSGDCEYHIVENWCYITTLKTLEPLKSEHTSFTAEFDLDIYRLLVYYLHRKKELIEVIQLS